ncbi:MAG: polysaccharide biosynthesis tyrosine autokinase [Porticoccaceae bacterium]|nr:polysaccharide biosynthesis tyrosine autokinase [Porticoccaceae bacterium]
MNSPSPSSMFVEQETANPQLDIKQLLLSVYRHKWIILALGLTSALAAAFYAHTLTPIYQAQASLLIDTEEANVVSIKDVYSTGYQGWEYRQTQYELLRSRNLAERVVRKLELYNNPKYAGLPQSESDKAESDANSGSGFNLSALKPAIFSPPPQKPDAELSDEAKQEKLISQLTSMVAGGISAEPVNESHLVALSFRSDDPELAANVVNTLADQYIESYLDARLSATRKASEWLTVRLADLKTNLKESEQRLQEYREQEKLVDMQGITTLGAQQIGELSLKYSEARDLRLTLESIKREVERLGNARTDQYLTIPAVQRHELISDLRKIESEAQRKVAELSKRYGVKHPKMIAANTDLKSATDELTSEVKKVVAGIGREYQLALRTEESLKEQLEMSKSDLRDINRKEFRFQELQREVDTNRQLYDLFFTRMKETSQTGGFDKANARIIDQALVPSSPVSPNKRLIITVGLMGGILVGAGIAMLLGVLDNTVKTPDEVQTKLKATLLGTLPLQRPGKSGYIDTYWENPQGLYAEAIRTVRTAMVLSGLDNPIKIIVITSSLPGEGKSAAAMNLGAAFAHVEKTLVIGADLRRPSLASKCGVSPKHPGLSNYVAGSAELDECIVHLGQEQLYIMPSGIIPPNPLEVLSSRRFKEALDHLGETFGRIIIDSAPLQAVSDALILSTYADSMIYVVKADSTSATVARRGVQRLVDSGAPLAGVVLNSFNVEKSSKYYGGSEYHYSGYYQSDDQPGGQKLPG